VLAQLDSVPGVVESRVDWTGTRFLLRLARGADEAAIADQSAQVLGDRAVADDDEERAALEGLRRGETWMRSGETLRLSREESHILAERLGGQIAQQLDLTPQQRERLIAVFQRELFGAFARIHRSGDRTDATLEAQMRRGGARIVEACREFLSAGQVEGLRSSLAGSPQEADGD